MKKNPLKYTTTALKVIIDDIKKIAIVAKIVTMLATLFYLIFMIIRGLGNIYANIVLLCLFAAYLVANYQWKFRAGVQLCLLLVVHLILWYKNMAVEIERMHYKEGTTVLNFPFISVFDKSELKEYSGLETFGLNEE